MNVNPDCHGSRKSQNHFSRRRGIKELLHLKDDDSGYIEGRVFMVWPPRNKQHRIQLQVTEDSTFYHFEVEILHKDGITFRPHERVALALKGMKVHQRMESSAPHNFPIVLRFPDGVVLKYLTGAHAGAVIDTWEGNVSTVTLATEELISVPDYTENTDEWYHPSVVHPVSDLPTFGASEVHRNPVPEAIHRPMLPPPCIDITSRHTASMQTHQLAPPLLPLSDDAAAPQSMQLAEQSNAKRPAQLSRKTRKKRRLRKEKDLVSFNDSVDDASKLPSVDVTTPCAKQFPNAVDGSSANLPGNHSTARQTSGHTNGAVSTQRDNGIDVPPPNTNVTTINIQEAGAPDKLKAGFRTQRGDVFTALSDLQKGFSMINVIGIVTSVNPEKKTSTNEWCRSFMLVDPSVEDSSRQGVKVNCFQKKYLEWLPQVQNNDIVILRKLKIGEYAGKPAPTGYSDKLRWAVYDPLSHSTRPPNKGDAPKSQRIDDGMGYEFCPYWEPFQDSTELEYCRQIGEWWKAKCELEGHNVSKIQCPAPVTKQHLLISEAKPDRPPTGFFNCTVEVLRKFNGEHATDVYVTDYTANPRVRPVQADWCPLELSDYVLKCTMWDNANNVARMMNPGEYWYLYNVRAKQDQHGYTEGTLQLADKLTQLDDKQAGTQPHLNALLARKKEFNLTKSILNSRSASTVFPEMLLQDVDGSTSFLTCIVELLHINLNSRDGNFIYVTDYTYNPDLPTTVSTSDWAYNLEHRALKIKWDDAQAQTATGLSFGSTYIIHNLRIKRLDASGRVQGHLGGERNLMSLCDSSDDRAQTLQRNKEKWKRENTLNVLTPLPSKLREEAHGAPKQPSIISANATLQEVLAKPAPNVFRVLARAKDFFPFSLEDACVLRCTKCDSSPPPSFQRCPRCDDMMETHSKWFYCLYIRVEDDKGSELIVSLSGKECTLLQDVDPTDFRNDREAFRRFLEKVDPVLGNLRDVHAAWSRNEDTVIDSPPMIFSLESWNIGNEKGYTLLDCNPV